MYSFLLYTPFSTYCTSSGATELKAKCAPTGTWFGRSTANQPSGRSGPTNVRLRRGFAAVWRPIPGCLRPLFLRTALIHHFLPSLQNHVITPSTSPFCSQSTHSIYFAGSISKQHHGQTDATEVGSSASLRGAGSLVCDRSPSRVHTKKPGRSSPRRCPPTSTRQCGNEHCLHTNCGRDLCTDRGRAPLEKRGLGDSEPSGCMGGPDRQSS